MKIGFIGAGKVGTAFGMYLKTNGFDISGYFSKSEHSAQQAAAMTGSSSFQDAFHLLKTIDMVFITTPDDQIKTVCDSLSEKNAFVKGQMVIHMSGALSSTILESARHNGCLLYSMHPLQAFADITKAAADLAQTIFSIEGDSQNFHILEEMLNRTGNSYFKIQPENKVLYHAAACIFSNYLVALMEQGLCILDHIGIEREKGFKAMLPLIHGTMKNIEIFGTNIALTGPIARGDIETIKNHTLSIQDNMPEILEFYKLMGQKTLEVAAKHKLTHTEKINLLKQVLSKEL